MSVQAICQIVGSCSKERLAVRLDDTVEGNWFGHLVRTAAQQTIHNC